MTNPTTFTLELSYDSLVNDPFFLIENCTLPSLFSVNIGDCFFLSTDGDFRAAIENESAEKLDNALKKGIFIKGKQHLVFDYKGKFSTHSLRLALIIADYPT